MRVSCVILNYNDASTTISLVNDISHFSSVDTIVIVDNCSTDDSLIQLRKIVQEKVFLLETDINGGYGYGNNWGIRYATEHLGAEYVVIANPDVCITDSSISTAVKIMKENAKIAAVAPKQKDANNKEIRDLAWKIPTKWQYIFSAEGIMRRFTKGFSYDPSFFQQDKEYVYVDCLPGAFLIIDTEKFLTVGGYDESFFLYCEETTLARKFKAKGYLSCLLLNDSYNHIHSVSINKSISSIYKQKKIMLNSRKLYLKKYEAVSMGVLVCASIVYEISLVETLIIEKIKGFFKF
ncbi:MAG: glycosyltransferase [Acetatifactor sp.]|nr:glycosyltransferase [Acetatifactor sp.]